MSKVFLSTAAFSNDSAVNTSIRYLENGITKIELSGGIYLEDQIKKIKKIKNVEFNLHNYFPPPETPFVINLATKNEKILKKTEDHLKNSIDYAAYLNLKNYSFHAGFVVDISPKEIGKTTKSNNFIDREQALNTFVKRLEKISNYANEKNIELLLENNVMKKSSYDFLKKNTTLMAEPEEIEFVMTKSPKNVNLLLDVAHLKVSSNILNFNLDNALSKVDRWIRAYHFSDNDGENDSNDLINENSWFLTKIKKDAIFYTVEVYNKNISTLKKQLSLIEKKLK